MSCETCRRLVWAEADYLADLRSRCVVQRGRKLVRIDIPPMLRREDCGEPVDVDLGGHHGFPVEDDETRQWEGTVAHVDRALAGVRLTLECRECGGTTTVIPDDDGRVVLPSGGGACYLAMDLVGHSGRERDAAIVPSYRCRNCFEKNREEIDNAE